eukprot:361250-Chlamydomonas_euryale.AAC.9
MLRCDDNPYVALATLQTAAVSTVCRLQLCVEARTGCRGAAQSQEPRTASPQPVPRGIPRPFSLGL